jgi:uncharacterized repeat protein (TIGR01451 family)
MTASGVNAGDVWTQNVGQPASPRHTQIPHLPCEDINLWGSGLAAAKGSFTIDGWPPSGRGEQDYASSWSYNRSQGGSQVISVISVKTLIETAAAHGDAPVNGQGYQFKLQLAQEPQKHKTFWVNCPRWGPADLSIAKRADPGTVGPAGQVLYTLTVDNHGPSDATGLTVSDTTPAGVSVSSAEPSQGSCTITAGHLSCALGGLPAGGSAQVLVTAMTSASASGNLTNKATVTADQPDPDRANNTASDTVTVPSSRPAPEQPADLEITAHMDRATADVGETLTYTDVVDNLGPATAQDVEVENTSSDAARLVSIDTDAGHCQHALPLSCMLGAIPAGAKVTITVVLIPMLPGTLRNADSVGSAEPHPPTAHNLATVTTLIEKARKHHALKREGPPPTERGRG